MHLTFVWSPRARGGRIGSTGSSMPIGLVPAHGVDLRRAPASPDHHRLIPALAEWTRRLAAVMRWSGVDPRTPNPAGDQGRHKQMIDPVAEPGQAAHASPLPFDGTNGMEPDDPRYVGACSNVLREEHEIVG